MRSGGKTGPLAMAAAVLAAVVAGCAATGTGSETRTACNSPGVSADELKLGFVLSDSGAGSIALASARAGVDARLGLVNDRGGVNGRKITYVLRDDGTSLAKNARVVGDLVQDDSVFGLITTTVTLGDSMELLAREGIPVVGLASESRWGQYPNMFSFTYADSPGAIANYLQSSAGTKAGIIITGSAPSTYALAEEHTNALRAVGIAAESVHFAAATDSPIRTARQLAQNGVNVLVGLSTLDDLAAILQAAPDAGLNLVASVALSGYDQRLLTTMGPRLAGVAFPVYFRPFEAGGPAIEEFRLAMIMHAPESGQPDQQLAMFAYIYTDMFLRGLELAGPCPTRESFIEGLRDTTDYDAGGLIAPVSLRDNAGKANPCVAMVRVNPAGTAFQVARERVCAGGAGSQPVAQPPS